MIPFNVDTVLKMPQNQLGDRNSERIDVLFSQVELFSFLQSYISLSTDCLAPKRGDHEMNTCTKDGGWSDGDNDFSEPFLM